MYSTARTAARPPHTRRRPRNRPLSLERGHADQGREGLGGQGPELGQLREERPRADRPDARHAPEELLGAPDGARADGVVQIRVEARNPALQPSDVRLELLPQHHRRTAEAIPLGGEHVHELPPPGDPRGQPLGGGIGELRDTAHHDHADRSS